MNNKLINDKKHRLENYMYFPEKINKKRETFSILGQIRIHYSWKWIRGSNSTSK